MVHTQEARKGSEQVTSLSHEHSHTYIHTFSHFRALDSLAGHVLGHWKETIAPERILSYLLHYYFLIWSLKCQKKV